MLSWIPDESSGGDFREWAKLQFLELAKMSAEAAEAGAGQAYFKGLAEARNALKDALAVHKDLTEESDIEEARKVYEDIRAAQKELYDFGGALMGAPPPEAEATRGH